MEMTIKNKILEQSDNSERKSSLTLHFRLCSLLLIVCILIPSGHAETLLEDIDPINLLESSLAPNLQNINISNITEHSNTPFCIWQPPIQLARLPSDQWQTQTNSNIAVNFAAKVDKKSSHLLIAKSPTTNINRQLWQARISAFKERKPNQSKNELRKVIRQIDSIEFKPQNQTPEPLIVVEPIQKVEPNEISSDTEMLQEQEPNKIERKLPYEQVTDHTLQTFKSLSQHPDQLHNPFELAEILFNSHCLREAAKCYQESLNSMTTNETDQLANKAWVVFQLGNCLQNIDPPTAMQMYRQLIVEYPNSPWADLAKAKTKLIDWYLKEKPNTLINKRKSQAL
jgi:tetratricopeptide (TPR) repeat protein